MTGAADTPAVPLAEGERVLECFRADRMSYLRDHAWLAALAMAAGMVVLWTTGNPHIWTGAVGGLAAVALRAWYLADEELAARWHLTDRRLLGPQGRTVGLSDIERIRTLGSAVQLLTRGGDKHLIKYQADRDATKARIEAGMGSAR